MKRILFFLLISLVVHAILFLTFGQIKWLSSSKTSGQTGQITLTLSAVNRFNTATIETSVQPAKLVDSLPSIPLDLPTSKLIHSDKFLTSPNHAHDSIPLKIDNDSQGPSDELQTSTEAPRPGNNQNQEVVGDKEIEERTRHIHHTHPANWLAFVVTVSEDGSVLEYIQVSKGDVNAAIYSMVTNEIKQLKVPESMHGQKILVSAPPLKIETDPAITAEYL